jgi:hypothetical protein
MPVIGILAFCEDGGQISDGRDREDYQCNGEYQQFALTRSASRVEQSGCHDRAISKVMRLSDLLLPVQSYGTF